MKRFGPDLNHSHSDLELLPPSSLPRLSLPLHLPSLCSSPLQRVGVFSDDSLKPPCWTSRKLQSEGDSQLLGKLQGK